MGMAALLTQGMGMAALLTQGMAAPPDLGLVTLAEVRGTSGRRQECAVPRGLSATVHTSEHY
jgi:hypothetical protein